MLLAMLSHGALRDARDTRKLNYSAYHIGRCARDAGPRWNYPVSDGEVARRSGNPGKLFMLMILLVLLITSHRMLFSGLIVRVVLIPVTQSLLYNVM